MNSTAGPAQLVAAVTSNDVATVKRLLAQDTMDRDAPGPDGTTALSAAVMWGCLDMAKLLLENGGSPNALNEGTSWSALHAAAFQEDVKLVQLLLEAGAEPGREDLAGRTPIDYASASEEIWKLFEPLGCVRSEKGALVEKGIIHKVEADPFALRLDEVQPGPAAATGQGAPASIPPPVSMAARVAVSPSSNVLSEYSRPGSAYVKCNPGGMGMPRPPTRMVRNVRKINGKTINTSPVMGMMQKLPEER
eukprot:TRINITY_DN7217_c0_g4_i1.p1 TRINITY_DN7217_c0_g4~~TRINITY_DN7217_c0_g4_i1.p1  ORF type:complete len:249 (-),score=49.26 TRINITY_DN7217_c0_g4_i1:298-1044(-)